VSTVQGRHSLIGRWIDPYLADVQLRDLSRAKLENWRDAIERDGAGPSAVNKAVATLAACLSSAVELGLLPANPARGIRPRPVDKPRPRVLVVDEIESIRMAVPTHRDAIAVLLMGYAGLRPEEVWALRWGDVGNVLVVDRAFTGGELRTTKTRRRRTVPIISALGEDLEAYRPKVAGRDELICPSEAGSFVDHRNWASRVWRPTVSGLGIEARPYDLRHSFASLAIHAGESVVTVAAWMGHASATTTLDHYGHLIEDARAAPRVSMDEAVADARARILDRDVRPVFARGDVATLRRSLPRRRSG
jgi:integrase